jgi:copper chaperone CopZ
LPLSGPVFGGEVRTLERVLLRVEGVVTTLVDPATEMAYVEYDPALTNPDALFAVVERSGFAPADCDPVWRGR